MVRRSLNGRKTVNYQEKEESDYDNSEGEASTDNESSSKKSKKTMKRKSGRKSTPRKIIQDEEIEESSENEEAVKASKNGTKTVQNKVIKVTQKRPATKSTKTYDESEESDDSSLKNGSSNQMSSTKKGKSSEKLPPVSIMVKESIKALKDDPKKGSTFASIKDTISRNWPVDMKIYNAKLKKYILNAEKKGEITRRKGHGLNGRFTIPGLKQKKKSKSSKLGKRFDIDEIEYVPTKTLRDEERIKEKKELERRREERAKHLEQQLVDKASRPKVVKPKKEFYEVKCIRGSKVKDGINYYLVQYEGWSKPQWEPEENVQNCWDLVEMFLKEDELRKAEIEKSRQECEQKGEYEVQRIVDVKFNKNDGKREFRIRWKGYSPNEDTWENEDDIHCPELVESFMKKYEETQNLTHKTLRVAPKKIERMAFTHSKRLNKRTGGLRVTYEDME